MSQRVTSISLRTQSPMDSLLSSFQGPPGGQLKLAATAQLGLCIIASTWVADTAGAVAILGILSVVLSNLELLQLVSLPSYGYASELVLHL